MAAQHEVSVTLDRPRRLVFTMGAFRRLREHGLNLLTSAADSAQLGDPTIIPTILWCALVDGDREDLSPALLEAQLMPGDLPPLVEAIGRAMALATATEVPTAPLATATA